MSWINKTKVQEPENQESEQKLSIGTQALLNELKNDIGSKTEQKFTESHQVKESEQKEEKKVNKKKKKGTTIPPSISITKAELWEGIESDEDLKGLKTWFTIKPNTSKRKRRGLGDLVLVINELIKQKIDEKKWEENH